MMIVVFFALAALAGAGLWVYAQEGGTPPPAQPQAAPQARAGQGARGGPHFSKAVVLVEVRSGGGALLSGPRMVSVGSQGFVVGNPTPGAGLGAVQPGTVVWLPLDTVAQLTEYDSAEEYQKHRKASEEERRHVQEQLEKIMKGR
jgi:hypothetical protein